MPERMLVHVLLFRKRRNDHLEIVLETQNESISQYYLIDQWTSAKDSLDKTIRVRDINTGAFFFDQSYADYILSADEKCILEVEADINDIMTAWASRQSDTTVHCYQAINHNCADAVIWFLNHYLNMPKPRWDTRPVTYHHTFFCCLLPSFFNCVSIPERVMTFIQQWSRDNQLVIDGP